MSVTILEEPPATSFSMSNAGPLLRNSSSGLLPSTTGRVNFFSSGSSIRTTLGPRLDSHRRLAKISAASVHQSTFRRSAVVVVRVLRAMPCSVREACRSPRLGMNNKQTFNAVVVAGTFDRLHGGHMLLLNKALSLINHSGRLVVGISNGPLLSHKILRELIQPFATRAEAVKQHLKNVARSTEQEVNIECVEIVDVVPDGSVRDPQLDCIVVSSETEGGAHEFNRSRDLLNLPPLKIVVVSLLLDGQTGEKLSSSSIRHQSLGTFVERVQGDRLANGILVTAPYMVGLTGGIAQGKSLVRELLKEKGAFVLDCDALGHLSYVPGTPTYHAMIAAFGRSIASPDGTINRKVLGSIVFGDPSQMDILKKIVWASVAHLVAETREQMAEQGVEVFVAEAALLLEANWETEMHEVWVVFAPPEVSRHRLMTRNQMTAEDADKRINSQMNSRERVALADVGIFNGGSKHETKDQVDKAWTLLLQRARMKSYRVDHEDPLWFRWAGLMRRLCVNEEVALSWWLKIYNTYREGRRQFHDLNYLRSLYTLYREHAHYIAEPEVLQLCTFFHRFVCHPVDLITPANEISSASSFDDFASEAGLDSKKRKEVKDLIILSGQDVSHGGRLAGDMGLFVDFKLAVIGRDLASYNDFRAKLRRELEDCDDAHFQTIFEKHLRRLMSPHLVFHTDVFRSHYSSTALSNLCSQTESSL